MLPHPPLLPCSNISPTLHTYLLDEGDTAEERAARGNAHCPVGGDTRVVGCIDHSMATTRASKGTPQGHFMMTVGKIVACTNGQPKHGSDWYSDGSKLTLEGATPKSRAGAAL